MKSDHGSGRLHGGERSCGSAIDVATDFGRGLDRRMRGAPIGLEEVGQMLARVFQLVLVQDQVEQLLKAKASRMAAECRIRSGTDSFASRFR